MWRIVTNFSLYVVYKPKISELTKINENSQSENPEELSPNEVSNHKLNRILSTTNNSQQAISKKISVLENTTPITNKF